MAAGGARRAATCRPSARRPGRGPAAATLDDARGTPAAARPGPCRRAGRRRRGRPARAAAVRRSPGRRQVRRPRLQRLLRAAGLDPGPVDRAATSRSSWPRVSRRATWSTSHLRAGTAAPGGRAGARGYRVGPFVVPGTPPPACAASTPTSASATRAGGRRRAARRPYGGCARSEPTLGCARWPSPGRSATSLRCQGGAARRPGRRPSTSTSSSTRQRREWSRHPHCGCAWADEAVRAS